MVDRVFAGLSLAAALFFVAVSGVAAVYAGLPLFGVTHALTIETQVTAGLTAVAVGLFFHYLGRRRHA
ncbi:hypothetical protein PAPPERLAPAPP_02360 [Brevundimonas phage vB_BpoS-Papperlapapp]|nr:hypothetical protein PAPPERLAPAPP_02360 [Brevundimonas phage vB_BpoS-Papperlapapp]